MTIKKSLISVAASALLVSAMTGCGSSDTTATTPPPAGVTGIQSATQAVDGYIYNATVKAHYLAENNASMKTLAMTAVPTTKDVIKNTVTLGGSTYALPADTNATVKSRIKYFSISNTPSSTTGTTFTPAAYIEADGIDGYDTNDTLLGSTVIYAPANSAIASPLTNLVVLANPSIFGTPAVAGGTVPTSLVDINATTLANLEANATKIATNLGLGNVNLLTEDPVALAAKNPTYKLVTALLKDATNANAILNATPAKNLAQTLAIVASATTGQAKTLASALQASAANGAFTTADVATMNVEKSVESGQIKSLAAPVVTGKFPVSSIQIGGVDSDNLTASGAKLNNANLVSTITMASNMDANISTTGFELVIAIKGDKDFVSQNDSNLSGALVVSVPFDLNATNGILAVNVPASTLIPYEVKASDGSEVVVKSDVNATTMSLSGTNAVSAAGKVLTMNIGTIVKNVLTKSADNNLTSPKTPNLNIKSISNIQVYLKDASGKIIGTDTAGTNGIPLAKGTLNGIAGSISATEALKIFNLGDADLRGTVTDANIAPNNVFTIGNADANNSVAATDSNISDFNSMPILNNNSPFDMNVTSQTVDTIEKNTTVAFTFGNYITDKNTSNVSKLIKNNTDGNTSSAFDVNTTLTTADTNLTTTITMVATDEFGDANTTTMNVLINRAPVRVTGVDGNKTKLYIENDSFQDINITGNYVTLTENNASDINLTSVYQDINVSASKLVKAKLVKSSNTLFIEFNTTLPATIKSNGDWNLSLKDSNMTDALGLKAALGSTIIK